jgi:hypothetical protein
MTRLENSFRFSFSSEQHCYSLHSAKLFVRKGKNASPFCYSYTFNSIRLLFALCYCPESVSPQPNNARAAEPTINSVYTDKHTQTHLHTQHHPQQTKIAREPEIKRLSSVITIKGNLCYSLRKIMSVS